MKGAKYSCIRKDVRFLKKGENKFYLSNTKTNLDCEVDPELFDFALHLDGFTNPASIEGVSEEHASEALRLLEKWDLIDSPAGSPRKSREFARRVLSHPYMGSLTILGIIVYTYFIHQTVCFLIGVALIASAIIAATVIDVQFEMRREAREKLLLDFEDSI